MSDLKPCPFCGGAGGSCPDPNHSTGWDVGCFSGTCEVEPHVWAVHHETAIDQWNRRATDPRDDSVTPEGMAMVRERAEGAIAGRTFRPIADPRDALIERPEPVMCDCESCKGSGRVEFSVIDGTTDCTACHGKGEVEEPAEEPDGDYEYERRRDAAMEDDQ